MFGLTEAPNTTFDQKQGNNKDYGSKDYHWGYDKICQDVHSQVRVVEFIEPNGPKESNKNQRNSWDDNMAYMVKQSKSFYPNSLDICIMIF